MISETMTSKTLYHGTTEYNAEKIVNEKKINIFKPNFPFVYNGVSKLGKKPGTLGFGAYFFSDINITEKFAKNIDSNFKIIEAEVEMSSDSTLDLTDEETLALYNIFKEQLSKEPIYAQLTKAFQNSGYQSSLEGIMLEWLVNEPSRKGITEVFELEEVSCIKAFTVTNIGTSKKSVLANSVEYCVKTHKHIKELKYYEAV
ncbi:hypothetical protein ACN2AU_10510 [Aerococcus viridans]